MEAYCKVNWPLSILAWGSELRFSRRRISLTWLLTSAKADSVWRAGQSGCRLELWEIYSEICSEIYKPARHQPMHRASGHPAVLFVLSESYRLLSQKDSWSCVSRKTSQVLVVAVPEASYSMTMESFSVYVAFRVQLPA